MHRKREIIEDMYALCEIGGLFSLERDTSSLVDRNEGEQMTTLAPLEAAQLC